MLVTRLMLQLLSFALACYAAYVTVDDTSPAWSFTGIPGDDGSPAWNAVTPSTPCTKCWGQPDLSRIYNQTWHGTAWFDDTIASVSFQGTACWVYGICAMANNTGNHLGVNLSFTLNGIAAGTFYYAPCPTYEYNFLLYSGTGMNPHVLTDLVIAFVSGGGLIIDYLIYDDGTSGSSGSSPAPLPGSTASPSIPAASSGRSPPVIDIIIPIIAVVFLAMGVLLLFIWRRLMALKKEQRTAVPENLAIPAASVPLQQDGATSSAVGSDNTGTSFTPAVIISSYMHPNWDSQATGPLLLPSSPISPSLNFTEAAKPPPPYED